MGKNRWPRLLNTHTQKKKWRSFKSLISAWVSCSQTKKLRGPSAAVLPRGTAWFIGMPNKAFMLGILNIPLPFCEKQNKVYKTPIHITSYCAYARHVFKWILQQKKKTFTNPGEAINLKKSTFVRLKDRYKNECGQWIDHFIHGVHLKHFSFF